MNTTSRDKGGQFNLAKRKYDTKQIREAYVGLATLSTECVRSNEAFKKRLVSCYTPNSSLDCYLYLFYQLTNTVGASLLFSFDSQGRCANNGKR